MGNEAKRIVGTVPAKDWQESCVLCGRITDMERDWPVSMRKYYIEGAGQLCGSCYFAIYKSQSSI